MSCVTSVTKFKLLKRTLSHIRCFNVNMSSTSKSTDSPSEDVDPFLPGHPTASAFTSASLRTIAAAMAASNGLPSEKKDNWAFYSTFQAFRDVMGGERDRLADAINAILRWNGIKGRCPDNEADLQEMLTEVNDQLLERINTNLDEAAGIKKDADPVLMEVAATKGAPISGSWNNRKNPAVREEVKLVTAKNISRPQLAFKDLIDNSAGKPFVPRLKEKPHAKKPLSILREFEEDGTEQCSHPYMYELDLFEPSEEQLAAGKGSASAPLGLAEAKLVLVENPVQLQKMVEALKKESRIAVDLEHHWYRSFQGFTSLIQISTLTTDYIVDPFPIFRELTVLNEVLADPSIAKVS